MNFKPFPEIITERLLLRRLKASDCDVILFLRTDKNVTKFIERPDHRKTKNISQARILIEEFDSCIETNHSITWGITLKNDLPIIGTICLWNFSQNKKTAEVGYDLMDGIIPFLESETEELIAFARYENYNTHAAVAEGLTIKDAYNRSDITIGLGFKVAQGAMFKADYQIKSNAGSDDNSGQFNFGTAIWF